MGSRLLDWDLDLERRDLRGMEGEVALTTTLVKKMKTLVWLLTRCCLLRRMVLPIEETSEQRVLQKLFPSVLDGC